MWWCVLWINVLNNFVRITRVQVVFSHIFPIFTKNTKNRSFFFILRPQIDGPLVFFNYDGIILTLEGIELCMKFKCFFRRRACGPGSFTKDLIVLNNFCYYYWSSVVLIVSLYKGRKQMWRNAIVLSRRKTRPVHEELKNCRTA